MVGYRHERTFGKLPNHVVKPRQVEPPVHRGQERHAEPAQQRQVQPVNVRVNDVEFRRTLGDRLEQRGADRMRIHAPPPEPQRAGPYRVQPSFGP